MNEGEDAADGEKEGFMALFGKGSMNLLVEGRTDGVDGHNTATEAVDDISDVTA